MIRTQGLRKVYSPTSRPAVDNLDLDVRPGEIFGFLGPNGAGKTTTLKMIVGILRPTAGNVWVDDIDNQKDPLAAKSRIGFVPDNPDLYDRLSGLQYLRFLADVYRVPAAARQERVEHLLDMFEMEEAIGDLISSYSHGMKQKTALMGALLHEPPVLILDEPMVGLDPRAQRLLKETMHQQVERGGTVFFSTHVLEVAERLCDRVGIIHGGQLIAVGTMDELRRGQTGETATDRSLEDIFLTLTGEEELV